MSTPGVDAEKAWDALASQCGHLTGEVVKLRLIVDGQAERIAYLESLQPPAPVAPGEG